MIVAMYIPKNISQSRPSCSLSFKTTYQDPVQINLLGETKRQIQATPSARLPLMPEATNPPVLKMRAIV